MVYLPGVACLNYANTIRPIVDNLPNFLRYKWEKQVVDYAEENNDEYPSFQRFSTMVRKQAKLKNHPHVLAGETPDHVGDAQRNNKVGDRGTPSKQDSTRRVLKTRVEEDQPKRNTAPFTNVKEIN